MRILICSAVLAVAAASLLDAASLFDTTLRISSERKFITDAMKKHKSQLDAHISTIRTNLNSLTAAIKQKQRESGKPCETFITVMEGIEKAQINSNSYFPSCQRGSFSLIGVEGVRDSLTVLLRTVEGMEVVCGMSPSAACQNQISSINRNLDLVRKTVSEDLGFLERMVKKCVEEKNDLVRRALVGHESVWSKCVENSRKWMGH